MSKFVYWQNQNHNIAKVSLSIQSWLRYLGDDDVDVDVDVDFDVHVDVNFDFGAEDL